MQDVLRNGCMSRILALCVTATSKTPPSFQDWGRNRLHNLPQGLSRTLYFRKVPNPLTMSVRQGLEHRKVLGTVVNTAEARLVRKRLLTPERNLRVQKAERVLLSRPRGEAAGLELCTMEKGCPRWSSCSDPRSGCRRGWGRAPTFQGSVPGVLSGHHLLSSPLRVVGEILQCTLIKMYLYVLCWCFVEVCQENSISATSGVAPDLRGIMKSGLSFWKGPRGQRSGGQHGKMQAEVELAFPFPWDRITLIMKYGKQAGLFSAPLPRSWLEPPGDFVVFYSTTMESKM